VTKNDVIILPPDITIATLSVAVERLLFDLCSVNKKMAKIACLFAVYCLLEAPTSAADTQATTSVASGAANQLGTNIPWIQQQQQQQQVSVDKLRRIALKLPFFQGASQLYETYVKVFQFILIFGSVEPVTSLFCTVLLLVRS
jgi:hypothetical protein